MPQTLRGEPGRLSLAEMRAAVEAGATAGEAFIRRLQEDGRKGARALAPRLRRRAEEAARSERMLELERRHWNDGVLLVAGVDEAGMGPLAGPIVAAAVILDPGGPIPAAEDSKALSRGERESLLGQIRERAVGIGVGIATVQDIAEIDVYRAGLLAMKRAVLALEPRPQALLVDARVVPDVGMPQEAHVKGDARSRSIAAASIVAKVERDALMARLDEQHPGYGFDRHAGYATPEHLEALRRLGPCAAHRTSWAALAEHAGEMSEAFYALREALRAVSCMPELQRWRLLSQQMAGGLDAGEARRLDALARRRQAAIGSRRDDAARMLPLGP